MNTDSGTYEIEMAGETYTLRPTLHALQQIDRKLGGMRSAMEQCSALSLDALVTIIAAGANLEREAEQQLPEHIFRKGIAEVAGDAAYFLTLLLNPTGEPPESGKQKGKA